VRFASNKNCYFCPELHKLHNYTNQQLNTKK
jgi:hypothetical protein